MARTKLERAQLIITLFVRISVFIAIISFMLDKRYTVAFVSAFVLFLTFMPAILTRKLNIFLPTEFEILIVVFLYVGVFLGDIYQYYFKWWWLDIALHSISGLVLGLGGFMLLYSLYRDDRVKTSVFLISFFSFSFAVSVGALWELVEFGLDAVFNLEMQKSGLVDTMGDLALDCLGALVASFMGYLYLKHGKAPVFKRFFENYFQ